MPDSTPPKPRWHLVSNCHQCGKGTLILRRSRYDNKLFYGCDRYPTCRATVAYDEVMETVSTLIAELARKLLVYERRAQMKLVPPPPSTPDTDPAA